MNVAHMYSKNSKKLYFTLNSGAIYKHIYTIPSHGWFMALFYPHWDEDQ